MQGSRVRISIWACFCVIWHKIVGVTYIPQYNKFFITMYDVAFTVGFATAEHLHLYNCMLLSIVMHVLL